VVVSTNDRKVHAVAKDYPKVTLHWRDASLCRSDTKTDDLIPHAVELIPDGDILWTHCTSPFVTAEIYDQMISAYQGHDSVMLVQAMRGFFWNATGPLHDSGERWPRTQTIEPLYKVTSGGFLASADIYRKGDRIGEPLLMEVGLIAGMDIDTQEEFELAEELYASGFAAV
jgi:CMP-N-acetylneuraminic acid synthetase